MGLLSSSYSSSLPTMSQTMVRVAPITTYMAQRQTNSTLHNLSNTATNSDMVDEDQSGRRTSNTSDHGDLSAGTFQINSGRDWEARHLDLMGMWSGLGDEKTRG